MPDPQTPDITAELVVDGFPVTSANPAPTAPAPIAGGSGDPQTADTTIEILVGGYPMGSTNPLPISALLEGDVTGPLDNNQIAPGSIDESHISPTAQIPASRIDLSGYQPNIDRIQVPGFSFGLINGSPVYALVGAAGNKWPSVVLPDAAPATVSYMFSPPSHWVTYNASFFWTVGGGSGNCVFQHGHGSNGDGETLAMTYPAQFTVAAPAANVVKRTTGLMGVSVTQGEMHQLQIVRLPTDAADTLGNSVGIIMVQFDRAS